MPEPVWWMKTRFHPQFPHYPTPTAPKPIVQRSYTSWYPWDQDLSHCHHIYLGTVWCIWNVLSLGWTRVNHRLTAHIRSLRLRRCTDLASARVARCHDHPVHRPYRWRYYEEKLFLCWAVSVQPYEYISAMKFINWRLTGYFARLEDNCFGG